MSQKEEPVKQEIQQEEKPYRLVEDKVDLIREFESETNTEKVDLIQDFEDKVKTEKVAEEADVSLIPDQFDNEEIKISELKEEQISQEDQPIEKDETRETAAEFEKIEKGYFEPPTQETVDSVIEKKFQESAPKKEVLPPQKNFEDGVRKTTGLPNKKEEPIKPDPVDKFKVTQSVKSDTKLFLSEDEPTQGDEGYTIQDRKGKFISVNETLLKKLNYAEEEMLELAIEDVLHSEKLPKYYQWLARVDSGSSEKPLITHFVGKHGDVHPAELSLKPERDEDNEITHYRGIIKFKSAINAAKFPSNGYFDQTRMIQDMTKLIRFSYDCSLNHLLEKVSQMVCKTFQFQRATLALLDRRRKAFVKQIMIGYTNGKTDGKKILEVPQEVIDKVFMDKFKVRVIYQDQDFDKQESMVPFLEERRLQKRDDKNLWKPNNVIIFNLTDPAGNTFGYISMDEPVKPLVPSREIFHNMEIFTNLTSLAIENFYRYSSVEKRNRRLKRLLVTGNIFKLNLSGSEIMKDSVWSIKFSLDFNMVLIGMINVETNQVDIKAVACDDRIKTIQLKEITMPLKDMRPVFKKEYNIGKSYFVSKQETLFDRMKDIYYDLKIESEEPRYWQWWNLLIVPIYEKHKNIVGFIFADDPSDCLLPSKETIHTLEIFANQLSIAIENRVSYLHLQGKVGDSGQNPIAKRNDESEGGLNRLVEVFFK
ncbi:PAS domain-containing protein [candidate division KSB1 bacterium]|nr:PAS domain-containing protein [candidate division KSB1 bacterium]